MLRPHESPYACVGPKIAGGGNDGKFMRQPVLKLKHTSQNTEFKTHREDAKEEYYNFNFKTFFSQYKELSDLEIKQIERWYKQLSYEIRTMQERLGY